MNRILLARIENSRCFLLTFRFFTTDANRRLIYSSTTQKSITFKALNNNYTPSKQSIGTEITTVVKKKKINDGNGGVCDEGKQKKTKSKTAAYLDLAKARLSALVVMTTGCGFLAAGGPLYGQVSLAGFCVVGTALCSSSAAALNQIFERDRDALMKRTRNRPLVTGTLTMFEAKLAAAVWGMTGTTLLAVGTDPVTTLLGLGNIGLYAGLYTYMKPRSIYNTQLGAIVGAIPPVMGWSAATSGSVLDFDAIILGSTLYLWQLPHFFALSYMYRLDYQRGGFCMLSCHEVDGERTSSMILKYSAYLSAVPIVSTFAGVTSSMFALEGVLLNSYALWVAHRFRQERTNANARKVFLTSLWYLPSWLMLFLLHSKVWDGEEDRDRDVLRDAVSDFVHSVRNEGRRMCLHEQVVAKSTATDNSTCPVVMTKKGSDAIQDTATAAIIEHGRNEGA